MLTAAPKVIAIDDEQKHLEVLVKGLNQYSCVCLPVLYPDDLANTKSCPHVRVIFADLHLSGVPTSDYAMDFAIIGDFIENTVKPVGPYFIVLWTRFSEQADYLQEYLEDRLQDVTKPFDVLPLDKIEHLDEKDNVKSMEELVKAIESIVKNQPQIAALLNWEERVLEATSDTVSSIFNMVGDGNRTQDVGRILVQLAVAAAGKGRVEEDRFHAVSEALLPMLADNIASLRLRDEDDETWQEAFTRTNIQEELSIEEAAKLNSRIHIDSTEADQGAERGTVIALPDNLSDEFEQNFGIPQEEAAKDQFHCRNFVENDDRFRWVLVQSQAACDYAQKRPGPLPYYLGLEIAEKFKRKSSFPDALWFSPSFESEDNCFHLRVNALFQISLPPKVANKEKPLYRLREQLLNDLIYQVHSYNARPGKIEFREWKPKK